MAVNNISFIYHHSPISAGYYSCISPNSNYSAILGGYNNCVNHDYAGVFGCCVSSGMACAFHANNFVAQNMPDQTGFSSLAPGGLYYCSSTCVVYRKP